VEPVKTDQRVILAGVSMGVEEIGGRRIFTARMAATGDLIDTATINCAAGRIKAMQTFLRVEFIDEELIS
jgi:hypothetical protein